MELQGVYWKKYEETRKLEVVRKQYCKPENKKLVVGIITPPN